MEAAGLGIFMISAAVVTALLEHPASLIRPWGHFRCGYRHYKLGDATYILSDRLTLFLTNLL
ncbi:hypothetical protein WA1_47315 [Scytonema hofmannii PCC 7110]|uniref:Uncharacterized protein n=2 Tax=Scytonema hofmannii TaxID=34078 RepID=A0A139WXT1_9CYAN|nr:hypothetical protein WA1_47315 [Scytonema hofmannii PCC 7110]